jgi:hypothetical protein
MKVIPMIALAIAGNAAAAFAEDVVPYAYRPWGPFRRSVCSPAWLRQKRTIFKNPHSYRSCPPHRLSRRGRSGRVQ